MYFRRKERYDKQIFPLLLWISVNAVYMLKIAELMVNLFSSGLIVYSFNSIVSICFRWNFNPKTIKCDITYMDDAHIVRYKRINAKMDMYYQTSDIQ